MDYNYPGLQEPTANGSTAVGASSVVVLAPRQNNQRRKGMILRNISPNAADIITVYFNYGLAVVNTGIVLNQNEVITDFSDRDESDDKSHGYSCYQGTVTAICATANGVLAWMER